MTFMLTEVLLFTLIQYRICTPVLTTLVLSHVQEVIPQALVS